MPKNTYKVIFRDLGLAGYAEALEIQEYRFRELVSEKSGESVNSGGHEGTGSLFFCEHPHVSPDLRLTMLSD